MNYLRRNDLFLMVCQYVFIQSMLSAADGYPNSPCPEILQYNYNSNQNLIGIIQAPVPEEYGNYVDLDVEVSVENSVEGYNINVDMLNPVNQVIDELRQGKPLRYQLTFTHSMDTPPVVTNISLNGNQICYGKPLLDAPSSSSITARHGLIIPNAPLKVRIEPIQPSYASTTASVATPSRVPLHPTTNLLYDSNSIHSSKPTDTFTYNVNVAVAHKVSFKVKSNYQYNIPSNYNPHNHDGIFTTNEPISIYTKSYPKGTTYTTPTPLSHPSDTDTQSQPTELHYAYANDKFNTTAGNDFSIDSTSVNSKKLVSTETIRTRRATNKTKPSPLTNPKTTTADSDLIQRLMPINNEGCGITTDEKSASSTELHPWLAALFHQNFEGLKFVCGSTLVSKKHVITAAHCVQNRRTLFKSEDILVALGKTNIKKWVADGSQLVGADSVHVHPEYKPNTADADVAMIILKEEAIFTNSIRPACMWIGNSDVRLITSIKGTVAGWGTDEFDNLFTVEAGQVNLPVVSQEDCVRSNAAFEQLTSGRTFCAGNRNNSGPCTGDSGSGFLMKINERWTLRGIVSIALARKSGGTCDLEQYVVFADVAKFMDWSLSFFEYYISYRI